MKNILFLSLFLCLSFLTLDGRVWTNSAGKSFKGNLIEASRFKLKIKKESNGRVIEVYVHQLSKEDQEYVQSGVSKMVSRVHVKERDSIALPNANLINSDRPMDASSSDFVSRVSWKRHSYKSNVRVGGYSPTDRSYGFSYRMFPVSWANIERQILDEYDAVFESYTFVPNKKDRSKGIHRLMFSPKSKKYKLCLEYNEKGEMGEGFNFWIIP